MSEEKQQPGPIQNGYRLQPRRPDRAQAHPALPGNALLMVQRRQLPIVPSESSLRDAPTVQNTMHECDLERIVPDRTPDHLHQEIARGLRYSHFRANANTNELLQVAASLHATMEVLHEKGLVKTEEVEQRKQSLAAQMAKQFSDRGMGVSYNSSEQDKYQCDQEVIIDCESRLHLCQAACCKLRFALSRQDVEEGIIKWDFANPYVIAQGADNYCHHLDRQQLHCAAHAHRPLTCRTYDCRSDTRIWLDFEKQVINPRINDPNWPRSLNGASGSVAATAAPLPAVHGPESSAEGPLYQLHDSGIYGAVNRLLQRLTSRPIIYQCGEWIVVSHGAFLSLGFGLGILYWLYLIGYRFQHSLPPWSLILGTVLASYGGSRLLFALERELASWLKQSAIRPQGHRVYGGLLASLLYYSYYFSTDSTSALFFADCAAPAVALGYAFGKLGCLSYGCCVGRPTGSRLAVRYTAEVSKAVGYYALKGIPLSPIQLYEALQGLSICILLSLLPASVFGTGQILGCFLLCLSLGRIILCRFRHRFPDERAILLISGVLDLIFVLLSLFLLSKGIFRLLSPRMYDRAPIEAVMFFWPILVAIAAAALALYLFGVHRYKPDQA